MWASTQFRTARCAVLSGAAMAMLVQFGIVHASSFECLIEPNQIVEIRSSVEGVIEKVFVKRGDRVLAGQVLVQLESDAERSTAEMAKYRAAMEGRIASAKNRLDYANKKLDRSEELNRQKFIAPQARDEAEAEKRIAEADLKDAQENQELAKHDYQRNVDLLNRRTLRSPFNGVVMDRMLNPGDLAEAGTGRKAMLKLAQVEPLRVEVVLPLEAHNKVKLGSAATVFPEGLGGSYPATVKVVDSVFDSASGTFGIRLELPNPKGVLPAGIGCKVEFPGLKGVAPRGAKSK